MTGQQVTRRVYSAEELHRLRVSCSQPRLSEAIEEHDGEEAELVKEHVLRGTKSFTARSFRSRNSGNSLRVPSNKENRSTSDTEDIAYFSGREIAFNGPVLGEISANGQVLHPSFMKIRPSPTPSLKKKKAEAIVKAHGSPQHVRVTAGGRIVPSEQSPLCHPRYGYSAIKTNGGLIKFAPTQQTGKTQWTQATQNGFVAQDAEGRLCQIVNGTILPLNEVDGAVRLYVPAPNLNISSRGSSFGPNGQSHLGEYATQQHSSSLNGPNSPPDPPLPTQTNALELEYSKLEHELKELDKTEVLHGRTMGKAAKEALVAKRRELVITLDNIRKAIKSIKSIPAAGTAPTSPRPTSSGRPTPPMRPVMPHILSHRLRDEHGISMPSMPPPQGPFFGFPPAQQFGPQYGFQPPQLPEHSYGHPAFSSHQPSMFVPPPTYDGSIAPPFMPFPPVAGPIASNDGCIPPEVAAAPVPVGNPPQTDGAGSFKDDKKAKSPIRSHALDIKLPESKHATTLKSNLNPMSPAYKPGSGVLQNASNMNQSCNQTTDENAVPSLSPVHPLKPIVNSSKAAKGSDETISPVKKSAHPYSSSVSSFDTADFFPRNPQEYSSRKYSRPESSQSEDKENVDPKQSMDTGAAAPGQVTPSLPAIEDKSPSTPAERIKTVKSQTTDDEKASFSSNHAAHTFDTRNVPDRQINNISPKNRRSDPLRALETPGQLPVLPSSSPQKDDQEKEEKASTVSRSYAQIDYSNASVDWIKGYRAGLARRPVEADSAGDFLDGYCAGLLKSKPTKSTRSAGSPQTPSSLHRPSPVVIQARSQPPPFEQNIHSTDTLKEAVFAPANENAILSPTIDGPHIDEAPHDLGAWAKNHDLVTHAEAIGRDSGKGLSGFPFPHHKAPVVRRHAGIMSEDDALPKTGLIRMPFTSEGLAASHDFHSSEMSAQQIPSSADTAPNRVVSMTGLDSHLYRQWPGTRMFSNQLEWKSASSIAQAAGMAAGHFAAFDRGVPAHTTEAAGVARGSSQHPMSIASNATMHTHSRFHEGSLDGITNPPNSPQSRSPPMSPTLSPTGKDRSGKERSTKRHNSNKDSTPSPTKVKFETMAEKVGIKVTGAVHGGPKSPTNKRGGWRDVWRSSKKDVGKDGRAEG